MANMSERGARIVTVKAVRDVLRIVPADLQTVAVRALLAHGAYSFARFNSLTVVRLDRAR